MIKIYTIYQYTHHGNIDDILAIKEGFSFFGFLCPFIWLIFNKLWKLLAIYLSLAVFFAVASHYQIISDAQNLLFLILNNLFIGICGNDFFRESLKKRGYEMFGIIAARDQDEAVLSFLGKYESL